MRKLLIAAALALCAFVIAMLAIVVSGLRDDIARSDVALVLGNKVELDGTPSPRLRARLDRTLELFRAGFFRPSSSAEEPARRASTKLP